MFERFEVRFWAHMRCSNVFEVQFFDVIPPLNIWSAYFSKNIAMLKLVLLKGFQKTQAIACSILELTIPLFSLTNELCYYI